MIKTIKVKKQLRLDELIKYAWDNQLNKVFTSDKGLKKIIITQSSIDFRSLDNGIVSPHDTFTVEVEEPITEDTRFKGVQEIYIDDEGLLQVEHHPILSRKSINDVQEEHDEETKCLYIYAAVDGETELIYERNEESINA